MCDFLALKSISRERCDVTVTDTNIVYIRVIRLCAAVLCRSASTIVMESFLLWGKTKSHTHINYVENTPVVFIFFIAWSAFGVWGGSVFCMRGECFLHEGSAFFALGNGFRRGVILVHYTGHNLCWAALKMWLGNSWALQNYYPPPPYPPPGPTHSPTHKKNNNQK